MNTTTHTTTADELFEQEHDLVQEIKEETARLTRAEGSDSMQKLIENYINELKEELSEVRDQLDAIYNK
jgi:uncharacterized membrane protein